MDKHYPREDSLVIQSTEIDNEVATTDETDVNTTFRDTEQSSADQEQANVITPNDMYSDVLDIKNYFKRPRIIATGSFGQGVSYGTSIALKPHTLFLGTSAVKRKWENYSFWKGTLKLKLAVNSTPFLYGMWMMDWCPLVNKSYDIDGTNPDLANLKETICLYSQRTKILIEPHKNENYNMTIPFIYPKQWHRFNTTADDMGTLTFRPVVPVEAASSTTSNPTFTLYAYFEDLELSGPTMAIQSEYQEGPISKPATIVSAAASKLTHVPVIGKFARATEIGAKAVGDVASLFGMCKVPPVDNVQPVSSQVAFGMGTGEIAHASERVTIDPKQEITRDRSRIGFSNEDELNVTNLCSRKAIVSITQWLSSDSSNTSLVKFGVNPSISPSVLLNSFAHGLPHPAAYIGHTFKYWRGDAVFNFKAVKSKFHTGRLLITFDPTTSTSSNTDSAQATNIVWDITKNDEITVRIKFIKDTAWCPASSDISGSISERGAVSLNVLNYSTGYLNVSVLNTQTAPLSTADIGIVTTLHWENMQFARPLPINDRYTPNRVQSDEIGDTIDLTDVSRMNTIDDSNYVGQEIITLRQLMNRSEYIKTIPLPNGTTSANTQVAAYVYPNIYPRARGFTGTFTNDAVVDGFVAPIAGHYFNTESNCMLSIMKCCFIGFRGSVIHTYKPHALIGVDYTMRAGLLNWTSTSNSGQNRTATISYTLNGGRKLAYDRTMSTATTYLLGNALSRYTVNDTLSLVVPYMNNEDFLTNTYDQPLQSIIPVVEVVNNYQHASVVESGNTALDHFVSAGADFDMFGYVNTPAVAYIPTIPTYSSGY